MLYDDAQVDDFDVLDGGPEMISGLLGDLVLILNTRGAIGVTNGNYPARYGRYGEIRTREFTFHFNPTGEIRYMRGLSRAWPHPWEWLKRSWGNDWIYYSVGLSRDHGHVREWVGESYLPCLSYESNAIREGSPYTISGVSTAFSAWSQVYATLCTKPLGGLKPELRVFVEKVIARNDETALIEKANELHGILGGRASVLPPDTRHVDYEVIPLNIADGCLYKCRFCTVKSQAAFAAKSQGEIMGQIRALAAYYGENLENFNALFVGDHDALAAGGDQVAWSAEKAFGILGFSRKEGGVPSLFLFASCTSFAEAGEAVFKRLSALPYKTYINIGLESVDDETLKKLGKPVTSQTVQETFLKMMEVNAHYPSLEVTANFLLGTTFSEAHHISMMKLLGSVPKEAGVKGCVYLSPLVETQRRGEVLPMFYKIKEVSTLPCFIYLIQRL